MPVSTKILSSIMVLIVTSVLIYDMMVRSSDATIVFAKNMLPYKKVAFVLSAVKMLLHVLLLKLF